jgi:hypothetical protein
MWWSGRHRQRHRNNVPGKREYQQKSGGQALHIFFKAVLRQYQ